MIGLVSIDNMLLTHCFILQTNAEPSPVFPEKDLGNSNSNQDITLGGGSSGGSSSGSGAKSQPPPTDVDDNNLGSGNEDERMGNEGVYIMSNKPDERAASFFAQPGILAGEFCTISFLMRTYVMDMCCFKICIV